ncbi:MAG: endonuclease [Bacteroidales bacterium]|nr:endonuclease [Bacteroidales bacterium]
MRKLLFFAILFLSSNLIFSQAQPPSDLSGSALRTWLKTNWYDGYHNTLGYDNARKQMYSYIDKKSDGQVYCVYTGFHQTASNTTYLNPINCEHTIPQSWFGSADPMVSDIFHLFPTHGDVNGARGSLDFAEINDNSTDKWYIVNGSNSGLTVLTSTPTSNIDAYSELNTSSNFEPREDHCGDVARAAFYFYTMYPTQAGSITGLASLQTLYDWHLQDPVDAWELQRNDRTESSQGNRNPYIDYPEIACRAWNLTCVVGVDELNKEITIIPNPSSNYIEINSKGLTMKTIHIYNLIGKNVLSFENLQQNKFSCNISMLNTGIYFIEITDINNKKILKKLIKE